MPTNSIQESCGGTRQRMLNPSERTMANNKNKALPGKEKRTTLILVIIELNKFCLNKKMLCGVKYKGMIIHKIITIALIKANWPMAGLMMLSSETNIKMGALIIKIIINNRTGKRMTCNVAIKNSDKLGFR